MKPVVLALTVLALAALVVAYGAGQMAAKPSADRLTAGEDVTPAAEQEFVFQTGIIQGRMVFVGAGGDIDGVVNPTLVVRPGTRVHVTVRNGDGMSHDLAIPDLGVKTALISAKGATTEVIFSVAAGQVGTYEYFCTVPGHRQAGMTGQIIVR